ncbi:hypothetical protein [Neisseria chenwenguii]|uniref:hypothetical protein n=1 Tax=Neisseria chenwenguii TaxID=1853278 RepID=UPI000F4FCB0C|nr:hypothetical protein [Neisseria chenwenguii]ROV55994.1 hypothetical protein EGS38_07325 [Neisseria chenwenguii]
MQTDYPTANLIDLAPDTPSCSVQFRQKTLQRQNPPLPPKKKCSRDNSLLRKMLNIPSDGGVTFTPGHFLDSGEDGILVSPEPIV